MHACEAALADHLQEVLDRGEVPDLEGARRAVASPPTHAPQVSVRAPDLDGYDQLLAGAVG
jgi:hypothetical protein